MLHRPARRGTDWHRAARYKGGARCECRVRETSIHMAPRSKSLAESSTISGMCAPWRWSSRCYKVCRSGRGALALRILEDGAPPRQRLQHQCITTPTNTIQALDRRLLDDDAGDEG